MNYYPDITAPNFRDRLLSLDEYRIFQTQTVMPVKTRDDFDARASCGFEKALYQHFAAHYLSQNSPYRSLIIYHGLGTGKTCTAITLAESILASAPLSPIYIVTKASLTNTFKNEIYNAAAGYNQCTYDSYPRSIAHIVPEERDKKLEELIKKRYKIMSYNEFYTMLGTTYGEKRLRNKTIIIDEAHNLTLSDATIKEEEVGDDEDAASVVSAATSAAEKKGRAASNLDIIKRMQEALANGTNNRLVLMSATPIYDRPNELFQLLYLCLLNDKRIGKGPGQYNEKLLTLDVDWEKSEDTIKDNLEKCKQAVVKLAPQYISYVRSGNPFTFAARFSPKDEDLVKGNSWVKWVTNGIVKVEPYPDGHQQKVLAGVKAYGKISQVHDTAIHNIVYPVENAVNYNGQGRKNYVSMEKKDNFQVYKCLGQINVFTPQNLPKYSAKIAKICEMVSDPKTDGIVLIYTQYIDNGVVPLMLALEHYGFREYNSPTTHYDASKLKLSGYKDNGKKYCVLTGSQKNYGDLIQAISADKNSDGSQIKVVIITKKLSEGITLKNVRTVHILDPWHNLSRIEQTIGRAIRTCAHRALPLEKRNVIVYMHAIAGADSKDMKDYKRSANKERIAQEILQVARENAIDCPLFLNLNYFPRSIFKDFEKITMQLADGRQIKNYQFGDNEDQQLQCRMPAAAPEPTRGLSMRQEMYEDLVPTCVQRLRLYIDKNPGVASMSYDDLSRILQITYEPLIAATVAVASDEVRAVLGDKVLVRDRNRFVIRNVQRVQPTNQIIKLKKEKSKEKRVVKMDSMDLLNKIKQPSNQASLLDIYSEITPNNWNIFARFVALNTKIGKAYDDPKLNHMIELLDAEGAFIRRSEIAEADAVDIDKSRRFAGYIDLTIYFDNYKMSHKKVPSANRQKYMFEASIVLVLDENEKNDKKTGIVENENILQVVLNEKMQSVYASVVKNRIDKRIPMNNEQQPIFLMATKGLNRNTYNTDDKLFEIKIQNQEHLNNIEAKLTTKDTDIPWTKGVVCTSADMFKGAHIKAALQKLVDRNYINNPQREEVEYTYSLKGGKSIATVQLAEFLHKNGHFYTMPAYKPKP